MEVSAAARKDSRYIFLVITLPSFHLVTNCDQMKYYRRGIGHSWREINLA